MAQRLKRLPAMRETWVRSLGWEDLLEKEMATHSRILAWRIQWREEPGGLQSMGSQESDTTKQLTHTQHVEYLQMPDFTCDPHQSVKEICSYPCVLAAIGIIFSFLSKKQGLLKVK